MASQYSDPRDFILHIRGERIKEYLQKRHGFLFPTGNGEETSDDRAARFMDFMYKQDEGVRDRVFAEIEYVNDLSSEPHIAGLCSYASHIDRQKEIEDKSKNNDERALVAYTNFPDEFDRYYSQANLEMLGGVREARLPKIVPIAEILNDKKMREFEKQVQAVYLEKYKGDKCIVRAFENDGKLMLRAYLEDLPTRDMIFEGKKLNDKHIRKNVFDALFVYNPSQRTLGVRAIGGKKIIAKLQKLFGQHFLNADINIDENLYVLPTTREVATLNLIPSPSSGVDRVYLSAIHLTNKIVRDRISFDVGGRSQSSGADAIQKRLNETSIGSSNEWNVDDIKITAVFKQTGKGRRKQVSTKITPNGTDLKSRYQDDVVRELLKEWCIYVG